MEYKTTEIHKIKSYPTYQFYAHTASSECSADEVFLICVLETLKWLRNRLKNFDEIPTQLTAPEPDNYKSFSESLLSFRKLLSPQLSLYLYFRHRSHFRESLYSLSRQLYFPHHRLSCTNSSDN